MQYERLCLSVRSELLMYNTATVGTKEGRLAAMAGVITRRLMASGRRAAVVCCNCLSALYET